VSISRQQVVNRLRDANYKYHDKGKHVEIYRQQGTGQRVVVPLRDLLPEQSVRIVLSQAGLSQQEIADFIAGAVKS
jgi:hypothetical protein